MSATAENRIREAFGKIWDAPPPPGARIIALYWDPRDEVAENLLQAAALGFVAVVMGALQTAEF